MIRIKVPSGIGDVSWIYSKICNYEGEIELVVCGDGPRRTGPFIDILPGVKNGGYGDFSYHDILREQVPEDANLADYEDQEIFLSANAW